MGVKDAIAGRGHESAQELEVTQISVPRNRLRALCAERVAELAESLNVLGMLMPIVITEAYVLVDGEHRLEAARRLGWHAVPVRVVKLDDLHIELAEIDANLIRAELSALERAEHLARRKEIYEALHPETRRGAVGRRGSGAGAWVSVSDKVSFSDDAASKTSISKRTVERDVAIAAKLPREVRDAIRETAVANNRSDLSRLARLPEGEQRDVAGLVASGAASSVRGAQRRLDIVRVKRDAEGLCTDVDVRVSDMAALLAELRDIDAIITDPPYGADAVALYGTLARLARQALAPTGVLAVMCGQTYLPEILASMAAEIPYRWTLAYLTPGGQSPQIWPRKVNTFWKPVLLFGSPSDWIGDVIRSDTNDNDKRFHGWGQSESGVGRLVAALTKPGHCVCDPFLGAGTTGVVSVALGRRFVGGDSNAEHVDTARARIKLALAVAQPQAVSHE